MPLPLAAEKSHCLSLCTLSPKANKVIFFGLHMFYASPVILCHFLCPSQVSVWRALFGKEADKLEQANDDDKTYYIIEKEPLVNTYISVPKENSTLNCAAFTGGIIEAILTHSGFPAKVTVHWHKGTTLMIKFDEAVVARDKVLEGR